MLQRLRLLQVGGQGSGVAVTSGGSRLLEMITRARIHLAVVLVDCGLDNLYERTMEQFQHAAAKGLVEFVSLSKD